MASKSKILVIGATGCIGKHIVLASAREGHPTFALVRASAGADQPPAKAKLLQDFQAAGVTLLHGDLYDHGSLVSAIKQVDVVISTVGTLQLKDQTKIIDAIKDSGNDIKRFLPSEFGNDVDRTNGVEPAKSLFDIKVQIRRAVEASGIPYTYVSTNFFAGYFLPRLGQVGVTGLPTDKVVILGDGNVKAVFVDEDDIGAYTVKAVDDPRTSNKVLYLRPPANILSHNELVSLWEKKVGKTFERVYVSEKEVLKKIQESPVLLRVKVNPSPQQPHTVGPTTICEEVNQKTVVGLHDGRGYCLASPEFEPLPSSTSLLRHNQLSYVPESPIPLNVMYAIVHSIFIKGVQTNFEIEPSFGVEASELYPDVKYTSVDEYLNRFL